MSTIVEEPPFGTSPLSLAMSSSSSVAYQEFELPIVGHYNYIPTEWVCGLFIALFTLTGRSHICHLYQSVWYNMYWLIFTLVLCAAGEIAGWSFRLWSNHHPEPFNPFFIQMLLLYIAPFFMAVSMYIILQRIISVVGVEHSKLKPRTYSIIFIVFDLLALCVQLVGGCGASINAGEVPEAAERDAWIIFGGVLVQIIVMTAYTILALKYCLLVRVTRSKSLSPQLPMAAVETGLITKESQHPATDPLATRIQSMIVGLLISTVFIVVRSIYRTIVLIDGWNGRIMSNQLLFNLLDGAPIVVAMVSLNVFHPGRLLPSPNTDDNGSLHDASTLT